MKPRPKLKIVSDGTVSGTKVYAAEGVEVRGIVGITWQIDSRFGKGRGVVTLTVRDVAIEVEAEQS